MDYSKLKELALWAIQERERIEIKGHSLAPLLKDKDRILIQKTQNVKKGDIVVAHHPYRNIQIIKQVTKRYADGSIEVKGNNNSTDSRSFGKIHAENILGKMTIRL